jgi:predicted DNA-binding transcriptional regulator AlpA
MKGDSQVTEQQNSLTPRQAANYIGVSDAALRLWRSEGRGPRFFRAGEKLIRYRRADLDFWVESRLSQSGTSEARAGQ